MTQDAVNVRTILEKTHRIAVIGMKQAGAAYYVPKYMERHGYKIVPVNPSFDEIDGQTSCKDVTQIDEPVDMVNVFRRSEAVEGHVAEILAMDPQPKVVWLQLGICNDEAARRLREAGLQVVQDRCLKVDHARLC